VLMINDSLQGGSERKEKETKIARTQRKGLN
jgi:hypothetical protein